MSDRLPWRGPGPGRPDLPLPPDAMPLLRGWRMRKRWRYLGVYGAELMLCAARVQIGPLRQCFWELWDRQTGRRYGHTSMRPGGGEVTMGADRVSMQTDDVSIELQVGEATPVEAVCASGDRGYAWTRKTAGLPIRGSVEADGRRWQLEARGVLDESAGYHRRHTSWRWSAGVGRSADGRDVAWNLVAGINDPPQGSERAIWVGGTPSEPAPVAFSGLEAIEFAGGTRLRFKAESGRSRNDNLVVFRSRYRHLFGTFSGSLDGVEIGEGFGVMEEHRAVW